VVEEETIERAIVALIEIEKTVAEGAGAAALAAAFQDKTTLSGKRVGLVLSGGNIDFDLFRGWVGTDAPVAHRATA
jgi:threonine dehydratase